MPSKTDGFILKCLLIQVSFWRTQLYRQKVNTSSKGAISLDKFELLRKNISQYKKICVCYSGGVDSAFLLKVAHDILGDNVLAVMADTPVVPRREIGEALALAEKIGVKCRIIKIDALTLTPELRYNHDRRCYFCKKNIFSIIKEIASELGVEAVADGKNADDALVYRPGALAAEELAVISPLADAGLTKEEIRGFSRELGLSTWNKPSNACLATRLPYNTEVTTELLEKIEASENILHDAGFLNIRVRAHELGDLARIEAPRESFQAIIGNGELIARLKKYFKYISLDLGGFRSGSMD